MNLISDDNISSITLEDMLSLLRQQAVVNLLFDESTLTFHSCTDDLNDDFLKKIRVKESVNYYDKFLCEHSE